MNSTPLTGAELIDCASANGPEGLDVAVQRCGYGHSVAAFQMALQQAGEHMGMNIHSFDDLLKIKPTTPSQAIGIEIAPDSDDQL